MNGLQQIFLRAAAFQRRLLGWPFAAAAAAARRHNDSVNFQIPPDDFRPPFISRSIFRTFNGASRFGWGGGRGGGACVPHAAGLMQQSFSARVCSSKLSPRDEK